jgi:ribose transport system ATP-binding protein
MSIRHNMSLPILGRLSRFGYIDRRSERERVQGLIDQLAVRTTGERQAVGALSGGNQQKVLIGRWLLTGAKILLLYDVTRGVDVATKHDIYALIGKLSAAGTGILLYSSDTEEMAHLCHRVLVMREGRIAAELVEGRISSERRAAPPRIAKEWGR